MIEHHSLLSFCFARYNRKTEANSVGNFAAKLGTGDFACRASEDSMLVAGVKSGFYVYSVVFAPIMLNIRSSLYFPNFQAHHNNQASVERLFD